MLTIARMPPDIFIFLSLGKKSKFFSSTVINQSSIKKIKGKPFTEEKVSPFLYFIAVIRVL